MFRDVPMFRYVFRNVPFSWLSTAFKRPKRAVILRFKMDDGCFELSRDASFSFLRFTLDNRNNNFVEYLANFKLKVFLKLFIIATRD